jgi:hypothetical protein
MSVPYEEARDRARVKTTEKLCTNWSSYSETFARDGYIDTDHRAVVDELVSRTSAFIGKET